MELMFWAFKTHDSFSLLWPLLHTVFFVFLVYHSDFILLYGIAFWRSLWGKTDQFQPLGPGERPAALVIIPSLLRNQEDFDAITLTVESCALNEYPSELIIVASIDGYTEKPELQRELQAWVDSRRYPRNVHVYIGGTPTRAGKMMAIEAGAAFMQDLVKQGIHASYPPIYYSIDGDGTLGKRALERLADRLTTPHWYSGNMRRVVAGKCYIRPDLYWQGWSKKSFKNFFTLKGQIYRQVGREFILANIARFNMRFKPFVNIPGGLYCTWSSLLIQAPYYMGFMRTIRFSDWVRWWLGFGPPKFSESNAPSLPEALTGPSDDTCMSFLAQLATWKNGELSLDAPRTPIHAFGRLLKAYFLERVPDYAPEARVFTYTPTTIKALWAQRVRWNASSFECTYRFKNAFAFHWEVGALAGMQWFVLSSFFYGALYYVLFPYYIFGTLNGWMAFLTGYTLQMLTNGIYTVLAIMLETDPRNRRSLWPTLFALPLAPLYGLLINFFGGINGVIKDFFLFGNTTKFAPEWTFKKGGTVRFALLFRIRRFFALCVRAVVVGDVPWGAFWFGWTETPWTPSGYDGWTTGKQQRIIPPVSKWFRRIPPPPPPDQGPDAR